MSKEEEKPKFHFSRDEMIVSNVMFNANNLCSIEELSSKQTKMLMNALTDYVWGRNTDSFLARQLDTATRIVFWNIVYDLLDNEDTED